MSRATLRKKELPLGTAPVHKLVLSFMLTALAGLLLNTVYSLTDALFVAHAVGDDAMGGISAALPLVPAALIPGATLQATGRKSAAALLYAAAPVSFLVFFALFGLLPENSSVLWAFPAAYAFSALASAAVFAVRGRSLFLCALPYARQE